MLRWVQVCLHLLVEGFRARRDAQIRFLMLQVAILRRKTRGDHVILCPEDRAALLRVGHELRHDVHDILGIVTRQTYRRWLREDKRGRKPGRVGRRRISPVRCGLILRFARENLGWGYRRMVGELEKLHLPVGRSTIQRLLRDAGLFPPTGGRYQPADTSWRKFIRLHMNTLVACDFLTKDILTPLGKKTAYCLFFIHLNSRKVFICPTTYHPDGHWMKQQARNVQMWLSDNGVHTRFLLRDRDTKFCHDFDRLFRDAGTRIVKSPVRAPNANAFAESWVGSVKREVLNHFICFGRGHLDYILQQYADYYNDYRPHQGVGNRPLTFDPEEPSHVDPSPDDDVGRIRCQRFLGGLLRHYYRDAA